MWRKVFNQVSTNYYFTHHVFVTCTQACLFLPRELISSDACEGVVPVLATTGRTVLIFPYLCSQHNDRAFTVKARSGSVCSIVRGCVCVRWLWSCSLSLSLLRLSPWCRWWSRSASISCISRRCPSRICRTRPGTALCPAGVTSTWARRSASSWCCAAGTEGRRRPSTAPVRKLGAGGRMQTRPAPDEREDRKTVFIYMLVSLIFKQEVMTSQTIISSSIMFC